MSIWERSVADAPAAHASWLAILRRLLPALKTSAWLVEWWDRVQEPVLDRLAEDKSLAAEAWAITIAILTSDDIEQEGDEMGQLVVRILKLWMQNAQLASQDGSSSVMLKAKLIHGGLLSYGKKRPKVRLICKEVLAPCSLASWPRLRRGGCSVLLGSTTGTFVSCIARFNPADQLAGSLHGSKLVHCAEGPSTSSVDVSL